MSKPDHSIDIFLHQGEVYFGDRETRIRTVLGSCVAITMWHPELLIGGMCHYMLPSRRARQQVLHCRAGDVAIGFPSRRAATPKPLDGKYADEALEMMFTEIRRNRTRPSEYQIKLFGGGNMFPPSNQHRGRHVGLQNIDAGVALLARHGLKVKAEHLGGHGHRNLLFDIWSGHVWLRHQSPASSCDSCEIRESCGEPCAHN